MDFLGFTLSVWAALAFGVFFIAMVIGCTLDRHNRSDGFKWFVFIVGLIALAGWHWSEWSWKQLFSAEVWKPVLIYLAIGLVYSVLEFFVKVRKEAKAWRVAWEDYKKLDALPIGEQPNHRVERNVHKSLEARFCTSNHRLPSNRITDVKCVSIDGKDTVVPVVIRGSLTAEISCWTLFWPAYAFSLILGDLLYEFFQKIADIIVALSSGIVRRMFSKVFTS